MILLTIEQIYVTSGTEVLS